MIDRLLAGRGTVANVVQDIAGTGQLVLPNVKLRSTSWVEV